MWMMLWVACLVPRKEHDALLAAYNEQQVSLNAALEAQNLRVATLEDALIAEQSALAAANNAQQQLQRSLDEANAEQATLLRDRTRLQASVTDMQSALNELSARKRSAEARIAQYQDLLERFQALIDAGQLQVQIVDGRMVVALATDILFASGSAELNAEGQGALLEIAAILASIPDRDYQVEGHTDNVPIRNEQYPSNWELAAGRAIAVVKTLVEGGLPETRISAASFSKNKPVAANDSADGRALNRRIEIVVVPDLSQLPGFEELNAMQNGADE